VQTYGYRNIYGYSFVRLLITIIRLFFNAAGTSRINGTM
jgi:hypothetical protein